MTLAETYPNIFAQAAHFAEQYDHYPQGRYATLFIVRQVQSEAIFRTEGSGEPLNKEFVYAGQATDSELVQRIVISKRKQIAVERRTGRELLRRFGLLGPNGDSCTLNTNAPCGECIDCMVYGFAVGGGGAQKSRVVSDDAFSLLSTRDVLGTRQFNALFETGTMRDPDDNPSRSIGTDEYVRPGTAFLDMQTLRDTTLEEFLYVVGNVLRSSRYGAVTSRLGKLSNHLVAVAFSDCELFSNLELTQAVYDALAADAEPNFPLHVDTVIAQTINETKQLVQTIPGSVTLLHGEAFAPLLDEIRSFYQNEDDLRAVVTEMQDAYPGRKQAKSKKG